MGTRQCSMSALLQFPWMHPLHLPLTNHIHMSSTMYYVYLSTFNVQIIFWTSALFCLRVMSPSLMYTARLFPISSTQGTRCPLSCSFIYCAGTFPSPTEGPGTSASWLRAFKTYSVARVCTCIIRQLYIPCYQAVISWIVRLRVEAVCLILLWPQLRNYTTVLHWHPWCTLLKAPTYPAHSASLISLASPVGPGRHRHNCQLGLLLNLWPAASGKDSAAKTARRHPATFVWGSGL